MSIGRPLAIIHVTQPFGAPYDGRYAPYAGHPGVDLRAAVGTPVYACHDGWVHATEGPVCGKQIWLYGEGQDADLLTRYNHLSEFRVATGVSVKRGQVIALSGVTGQCDGAHLDLMLRIKGVENPAYGDYLNPMEYMEEEGMGSKLGLHIQGHLADAGEWYNAIGNVGVVKQIDPDAYPFWGGASVAKVGRLYFEREEDKALIGRVGGGREYVRWCAPRWEKAGAHWWELWNEPPVSTREQRVALVRASLEAIAAAPGRRFVLGNFSVGQPEGDLAGAVTDLLPLFQAAVSGGHRMGYHAYWTPEIGPDNEWYARRWQLINQVLSANGIAVPDNFWLLSEAGIDLGIRGQEWAGKGWAACVGREDYWRALVAFDDICMADRTVWAWTPFTSAPNADWQTFDFDATLRGWARDRIRAIGWGGGVVQPQPPTGGLPPTDLLAECRRFYQERVPATVKAAARLGYVFHGEERLSDGNYAAICTRPSTGEGVALVLEVGTWRVLRVESL